MNRLMARILCMDDEPLNLSLLEAMLSQRGYDVVTAVIGPEALEKIKTERIDICLLDVMMPEMDGFEVCRRIKSDDLYYCPITTVTIVAHQCGNSTLCLAYEIYIQILSRLGLLKPVLTWNINNLHTTQHRYARNVGLSH